MQEETGRKKSWTNHCEETLKVCLKTVLHSLTDESFTQCLKKREEGVPAILLYLIEEYGGNNFQGRDNLGKIISEIVNKMAADERFAGWVGDSIKPTWLVLYFASQECLEFDETVRMLTFIQTNKPDYEDIPNFLLQIGQSCGIADFQKPRKNKNLADKLEFIEIWKNFIAKMSTQTSDRPIDLDEHAVKIQECAVVQEYKPENEARELYEQMESDLRIMNGSELDKLIQDDLIRSFACENFKSDMYGEKEYYELTKKIEKKAKQFDVYSGELRMELEEPPQKNKLYNKILNIRSRIHPIFVPELSALLNKSKKARGALQGKDAVVLLGSSGAGKTTMIQVLLGYPQKLGKDSNGIPTLVPITKLSNEHKEFVAKASSKSVTKYVSAIQINLKKYDYDEIIYLVDTPGFFDSGGVVVDACNSLSTIEVLGTANSIRFGFVFNYKSWGKRADAFKDFVKIISKLFSSYDRNKSKVIYFLNEFTKEEIEGFCARVKEFRKNGLNQYEKGDKKLVEVVDHIISLLERLEKKGKNKNFLQKIAESQQLVWVNPIQPDLGNLYEKILDPDRKIMNPKNQLDSVISQEVRQVFINEVNQLQSIINSCIMHKKTSALKYYFWCLEKIADITKEVGDCAQARDKLQKIIQKAKNSYNSKIQAFQTSFNKILNLRTDDDTFSQLKEEKRQLEEVQQTYRTLPGLESFSRTEEINDFIKDVSTKLLKKTEQGFTQDLFDTVSYFSKHFNEKFFQQFARQRKKKQDALVKEIQSMINDNQFAKFGEKYRELIQICKFTGDMDEEYNPINLTEMSRKKIELTKQAYVNYLFTKVESTIFLKSSDIDYMNKTIEVYNFECLEIPELKQAWQAMIRETLKIFRTYITKITAFLKNNNQIQDPANENTVFTFWRNARELTKVKQIQGQAKNDFDYLLAQIKSLIDSRKKSLDDNIAKQKIDQWRYIYREIKQLEKLSYLCETVERKEISEKINSSKNLLKEKMEFIESEISNPYTLETSAIQTNTQRIINSYKICFSIIQENSNNLTRKLGYHLEEFDQTEVEGKDEIVMICGRILERVRSKLEGITLEIKKFIQQKMEEINKLSQTTNLDRIPPGIITYYTRVKRFFDVITKTDFNPPKINGDILQVKQLFERVFIENFRSFENLISNMLNQILRSIQQNNIKTSQASDLTSTIIKLKKIKDKVAKIEVLKELITNNSIDIMDHDEDDDLEQTHKIPSTIQKIQASAKQCFSRNSLNSNILKSCDVIELCKVLEGIDSLFSLENKFSTLSKQLSDQMNRNTQKIERSIQQIMEMSNLSNLLVFKQVYDYLSKFPQQTKQSRQLSDIMDHVKQILSKEESNFANDIKKLQRNLNSARAVINGTEVSESIAKITYIQEAIKKLRKIVNSGNQTWQIGFEEDTSKQIGDTLFKIIEYQVQKVKKMIEKRDYQSPEPIIEIISTLEEMLCGSKIENEPYRKMLESQSGGNGNMAEKLKAQIQSRKGEIQQKFYGQTVVVDRNFSEQFQSLTQKKQENIKKKLKRYYQNKINALESRHKSQSQLLLEQLYNLKNKPEFQYLSDDIKKEIQVQINSSIKQVQEKYKKEKEEVESAYQFSKSAELIKKEQRSYILKLYELKTKQEFDRIFVQIGNSVVCQEIIGILGSKLKLFEEKDLLDNPNFTKIFDEFCGRVEKALNQFAFKRIGSLKKVLAYQNGSLPRQKEVSEMVQQIKQIYLFLDMNKNKMKGSNPKKCLQELSKMLMAFADELVKKSQFKFEDLIQNDPNTSFNSWCSDYRILSTVAEQLNDMEQQPDLEDCYNSLSLKLQSSREKEKQILVHVKYIEEEIRKTKIFSQNIKNISDMERKQQLEKLQYRINSLKNLQKFGAIGKDFFKKDFAQITKELELGVEQQIQETLVKNCEDVNRGFQDLMSQFNKEINVSLNLITMPNEFLKISKTHKNKLITTIEQNYISLEEKCSKNVQILLEMKEKQEKASSQMSQIKLSKGIQITESCKIRQQRMELEQSLKLQDKLRNVNDEEQINFIKKAHESEVKLLKQEIWENLGDQTSRIDRQQTQKQIRQAEQEKYIMGQYCDSISRYWKGAFELSLKQNYYKQKIEKLLAGYKNILGSKKFKLLFEIFKTRNNSYASTLICSFQIFKSNQALQIYAKIKGYDREYVLSKLQLSDRKKDSLRKLHEKYQDQFKDWTKKYQLNTSEAIINQLLESIEISARSCKQFYDNELKVQDFKPELLISRTLVLMTLLKSEIDEDQVIFAYQPHPAQVITIFLCLSLTQDGFPRDLNSKMAQVGTGEGKSLILAGLSSYLALCGFEVSCVCYSEYLSSRDYSQHQKFFQKMKIDKKIMYGTFNTVCQSLLNKDSQDQGSFSAEIKKILQSSEGFQSSFWSKLTSYFKKLLPRTFSHKEKTQMKKIMLVDQFDVFFNKDFFGQVYRPQVSICSPEIKQLIQFVWRKYKQNPQLTDSTIKDSEVFKNTVKRFKKLEGLLQDQIIGMISGCKNSHHNYIIRDNLIQYPDQDGYSSKLNYGYTTQFAYLKEHDHNRIACIQKAFKLSFIIAEFSYAMLPTYFRSMIGVTGTYSQMPASQKNYMRNQYNVQEVYIIPSIYGSVSQRVIQKPVIVEPEIHMKTLIKNIEDVHHTGRPVLVFCETNRQLENLYNSQAYQHLQSKTAILNQTHKPQERDPRIKKTCRRCQITLMTKIFGRGTDFIVIDESIFKIGEGGLHVIQSFISTENSEQIQIQGRTARKGDPGTYILIAKTSDLERLEMEPKSINNFYYQVKEARRQKQIEESVQQNQRIKISKAKHEQCIKIYRDQNIKVEGIISYIQKLNKYGIIRNKSCKTTIFVDGTKSMNKALSKTRGILQVVMNDLSQIIGKYTNAKEYFIQLGVYRNYNCPMNEIRYTTAFQNRPQNLLDAWKEVKGKGGLGNQALEVAYHYLNQNPDIDQAIFIGDARANTDQQTINNRKKCTFDNLTGEEYWSKHLPILSSQAELAKIVERKVPIHCFYIKADQYFKRVSKQTGGVAEKFEINSENAATQLSNFIAARILEKAAQNQREANEMINSYKEMEKKRYSSQ